MTATLIAMAATALAGVFAGLVIERWRNRRDRAINRAARFVADIMPGHGWTNDPDGNFTSMSPGLLKYFGVDADFFERRRRTAESEAAYRALERGFVHPDDGDAAAAKWRHSLATGTPFINEHRLKRADGAYRWYRVVAIPARDVGGRIVAWSGMGFDIDDEKRSGLALARRERELQRLIDTVPVQIWRASPGGEPGYFNERLRAFVGVSPDDFAAGPSRLAAMNRALIHADDLAEVEADLMECVRTGRAFARRLRIRRADGVYRWSEHRAEPLRDADGTIIEWYGICFDIDEIKQAEDALRRSERAYRELIDTLPAMIWSIRTYDGPSFFNRTLLDYTGYDPDGEECRDLGTAVSVLVHPDDHPALREMHERDFRSGVPMVHRFRVRRADGVYRWVEERSGSGRDESGAITGRYGILIDVEDEVRSQRALREMRDRLARAAQAATLSELSASIAHEVNQPLAAVIANAQACQNWLAGDPPNLDRARLTATRVIGDANAAADVITRIRALFKQAPTPRADETINAIIAEVCDLVAEEAARKGLRLARDLAAELPRLSVDRVQIQQVLLNVIRNALEATPAGVASAIVIRSRRTGGEVIVDVADQGHGMADTEHAFEPFFTTKANGMGMGLAVSRSIIEAHGGRLFARPNTPRGTTVAFALPCSVVDAVTAHATVHAARC